MPLTRRREPALKPVLLYFLATANYSPSAEELPGVVAGFGDGRWEAFELAGSWLRWSQCPSAWAHLARVVDDLRRLWEAHADEIRAATPAGETPWICSALAEADEIEKRNPWP
jgi:hypothetical protein